MDATPVRLERPSPMMRLAGSFLAFIFFLVPRRYRFALALRVARWLEPVIARTHAWRARRLLLTDGVRETSLDLLLAALTRHGVCFDPQLVMEGGGADCLPPPGTGLLLLGPHTMLSTLFIRLLDARGHVVWGASAAHLRLPGARRPARILLPSPQLPLQIRSKLREGCMVFALIDRGEDSPHTVNYQLAAGTMRVSGGLLRLALATRTPTYFIATRTEGYRVVSRVRPAAPAAQTLPALLDDFAAFVDAALRRSGEAPAATAAAHPTAA
jgi:hypothetical protein